MSSGDDLEAKLVAFADDLIGKAKKDDTPLDQALKIFKEVRELYATLTKEGKEGDKPSGRRPTTIDAMRRRIAVVDGGEDGRA